MKKILVVDDQAEVRELVKVTLEVNDYQLLMAENGQQALDMVKAEQPDLILLDIMMPGGPDGIEVCRQLKSEGVNSTIVMLTAKGEDADVDAGYAAGADDYFVKPFSPLELIEKVEDVLGR